MDFDAAFARHHPALFRYLHRLTGDADAAADIAQESFVRLLDHEVPETKLRSWLFTVATNLVRDRARSWQRHHRLLQGEDLAPAAPAAPDEAVERGEEIAIVRQALDQLSERDRQLLLLREEGFRYSEIAELTGITPTSVGKLLARALERFTKLIESAESTPGGRPAGRGSGHEARGEEEEDA